MLTLRLWACLLLHGLGFEPHRPSPGVRGPGLAVPHGPGLAGHPGQARGCTFSQWSLPTGRLVISFGRWAESQSAHCRPGEAVCAGLSSALYMPLPTGLGARRGRGRALGGGPLTPPPTVQRAPTHPVLWLQDVGLLEYQHHPRDYTSHLSPGSIIQPQRRRPSLLSEFQPGSER